MAAGNSTDTAVVLSWPWPGKQSKILCLDSAYCKDKHYVMWEEDKKVNYVNKRRSFERC